MNSAPGTCPALRCCCRTRGSSASPLCSPRGLSRTGHDQPRRVRCGRGADGAPSTRDATVALATRLARLDALVSVDIADGFGADPAGRDLAAELAGAGAAGINLEDGRADGSLAPVDVQCALVTAVKERVPGLFVNARTDSTGRAATPSPKPSGECGRTRRRARTASSCPASPSRVTSSGSWPSACRSTCCSAREGHPGRAGGAGRRGVGLGSLPYRMALAAAAETARAVRDGRDLPLTAGRPRCRRRRRKSGEPAGPDCSGRGTRAFCSDFAVPPGYLNTPSVGIPPAPVAAVVAESGPLADRGARPGEFDQYVTRARAGFARLLGVDPGRVASGASGVAARRQRRRGAARRHSRARRRRRLHQRSSRSQRPPASR